MFYEPYDQAILLAPLPAQDLGRSCFEHVDADALIAGSLIGNLVEKLREFTGSSGKDAVTLSSYLYECGLADLPDLGLEAFLQAHFPAGPDRISSIHDVYEAACAFFAQRDYVRATGLFALIASLEDVRSYGQIALSACAARQGLYKSGYDLAVASVTSSMPHPRSCFLAGHCALRLDEKKTARHYLAFASRIARRSATYKPERRASQSKLLALQFA
ncbi:hypothetical protein C8N35_111126 [Breoghania corrubedonensis]|uniref:Uncharacterized protein n=1 Tax=Breoghania corrubedonensis TaxID=665038 RepID=A0A2T5UYT2_9HYPH|nr:hypothetical protein [Breoghania corrubedonensis]PTW56663.1 hypothetical protein C8N35_111126 [Breoghania corrubedonensis]